MLRPHLSWTALLFLVAGIACADSVTLTPLRGVTEIQPAPTEPWKEIRGVQTIQPGTRIHTGKNARAMITSPAQHQIAIGPESWLTVQLVEPGRTKLYLKDGVVRSKVTKLRPEEGQYFKIQTPTAVCAVRGTDFITQIVEDKTIVRTIEGSVAFGRDEVNAIMVTEGLSAQQVMTGMPGANLPPPVEPFKVEGHQVDWNRPQDWDKSGAPVFGPDDHQKPTDDRPPQARGPNQPPPPPPGGTPGGNPIGPDQPIGPPPAGNNVSAPLSELLAVGLQAINQEIASQVQTAQANGTQINELYRNGSVRFSPIDNQLHQYVDMIAVAKSPAPNTQFDGIGFLNVTRVPGKADSLNYTLTTMDFQQPFAATNPTLSDVRAATQIAFSQTATSPTNWAKLMKTERFNGTDTMQLNYDNGVVYQPDPTNAPLEWVTKFNTGSLTIAGPKVQSITGSNSLTLFSYTGGALSPGNYYGGIAPTAGNGTINNGGLPNTGIAHSRLENIFGNGTTHPYVHITRDIAYIDASGQIATPQLQANSGFSPLGYFGKLAVHETITSNLFTKPMTNVGSTEARIFAGIDHVYNDTHANAILTGSAPKGAPTGLLP